VITGKLNRDVRINGVLYLRGETATLPDEAADAVEGAPAPASDAAAPVAAPAMVNKQETPGKRKVRK